jgi:hypothetical protein
MDFSKTLLYTCTGEEWYEFRQAVQQDMMRFSSALHYVSHIQDLAQVNTACSSGHT